MMGTLAGGSKSRYAPGSAAKQSPARLALGFGFSLVALAVAACGGGQSMTPTATTTAIVTPAQASGGTQPASRKPNIILILTDDQAATGFANMQSTMALIRDQGMTLPNYFVSLSLCCPSRVTTLRGQYAHNHGVLNNGGPRGGFQEALRLGIEQSTIAAWLKDAGYRTGLFGKYLNGYRSRFQLPGATKLYIPPGWTTWGSTGGGSYTGPLNLDGVVQPPSAGEYYQPDVVHAQAIAFIDNSMRDKAPFFAMLTPYAPHSPATSAIRHQALFEGATAPRPPSFNEADVSDKPPSAARLAPLTSGDIAALDARYRDRQRALQSVDEMVADIVATLTKAGQIDNTYIFVTSDNGWMEGQHRITSGKLVPYEPSIRVSMYVRGPGIAKASQGDAVLGNTDLAVTFAALAGAPAAAFVDGRSIADVLGAGPGTGKARRAFLIERFGATPEAGDNSGVEALATWYGFRTATYKYVRYADGFQELYDLTRDPDELDNLAPRSDPAVLAAMAAYLGRLSTCNAAACHTIEDEQPPTIRP